MVKTEFVFRGLEAVFGSPTMAFDGDKHVYAGSDGVPRAEERALAVSNIAPDQQATRPHAAGAVFFAVDVGQLEIGPVEEPRTFRAFACGQALSCRRRKILRDLLCRPGDPRLAGSRSCRVGSNGLNAEAYLAYAIDQLARGHLTSRLNELLPWNCKDAVAARAA